MFSSNASGPSPAEDLQPALSHLETGMLYNAEYVLQPGRHVGVHNVVAFGHLLSDPHRRVRTGTLPAPQAALQRASGMAGSSCLASARPSRSGACSSLLV